MNTGALGPLVGEVELRHYPLWRRGKVRDVFDLGDKFLFIATDRISAFDIVLPDLIPDKGRLLTATSRFWFDHTQDICPNHVVAYDIDGLVLDDAEKELLEHRCMQVRKADRIDIECVVRSHLAGSGWREYRESGTLAGVELPKGLSAGDPLPVLQFTPATKNDDGHDENISTEELRSMLGSELTDQLEQTSMNLSRHAQQLASRAGFILADTKFEFGFVDGQLTLIDEVLTPDSSRYWNTAEVRPGTEPPGFDKQPIRDWLSSSGWDKEPPAPNLPADIIHLAHDRYAEVLDRLTTLDRRDAAVKGADH